MEESQQKNRHRYAVICGVEELNRGYEQTDERLRVLGAQIERTDA